MAGINKSVESKNELLRLSANQIRVLERNLSNFAQVIADLKEKEQVQSQSKRGSENSSFKNNEEVISALQSLRVTWSESNMKYEELKSLVEAKCKDEEIPPVKKRPQHNASAIEKNESLLLNTTSRDAEQQCSLVSNDNRTSTPIVHL
jgi:hypothetical protein